MPVKNQYRISVNLGQADNKPAQIIKYREELHGKGKTSKWIRNLIVIAGSDNTDPELKGLQKRLLISEYKLIKKELAEQHKRKTEVAKQLMDEHQTNSEEII